MLRWRCAYVSITWFIPTEPFGSLFSSNISNTQHTLYIARLMSSLTAARARPCAACVLRIQAAAVSSSHGGIARARYSNSLATNEPVAGPSRQNARFQSIRHFTSTIRVSAGRKSIERERSKHINMEEFPPERIRHVIPQTPSTSD